MPLTLPLSSPSLMRGKRRALSRAHTLPVESFGRSLLGPDIALPGDACGIMATAASPTLCPLFPEKGKEKEEAQNLERRLSSGHLIFACSSGESHSSWRKTSLSAALLTVQRCCSSYLVLYCCFFCRSAVLMQSILRGLFLCPLKFRQGGRGDGLSVYTPLLQH